MAKGNEPKQSSLCFNCFNYFDCHKSKNDLEVTEIMREYKLKEYTITREKGDRIVQTLSIYDCDNYQVCPSEEERFERSMRITKGFGGEED